MDVLYKTQADLLKGKEKLEQMMQNLEKEKVRYLLPLWHLVEVCFTPIITLWNTSLQILSYHYFVFLLS